MLLPIFESVPGDGETPVATPDPPPFVYGNGFGEDVLGLNAVSACMSFVPVTSAGGFSHFMLLVMFVWENCACWEPPMVLSVNSESIFSPRASCSVSYLSGGEPNPSRPSSE